MLQGESGGPRLAPSASPGPRAPPALRPEPSSGPALRRRHQERDGGSGLGRVQEQEAGGEAANLTLGKPHVSGEAATCLA